jgi:5-methylcytosine-specific restriction endonuclease McrA
MERQRRQKNGGAAEKARWRKENPEKAKANSARYRKKNKSVIDKRRRERRALIAQGEYSPCDHQRAEILKSNWGLCSYCNTRKATDLDHLVPLAAGGLDRVENLVPACDTCNGSKGNRTLIVWLATGPDCLRNLTPVTHTRSFK